MDPELLSITEVGEATGLPSSALRYYESAGLITPKERRGGRRYYTSDVLRRLAVLALLQDVGFTIKEAATVLGGGGKHAWRSLAEEKLHEIDAHIERVHEARDLLIAALSCGCGELDGCELVGARRGRHDRAIQTLSLGFGPPVR